MIFCEYLEGRGVLWGTGVERLWKIGIVFDGGWEFKN